MHFVLLIPFLAFMVIASYYQAFYLLKFHKNQDDYPLKQLSPKITLHQGIFLIISQIVLLIEIYKFLDIDKRNCEEENEVTNGFIAFFYIFSRGCCFSFALLKTARITVAFSKKKLKPQSFLAIYFSSEKYLLITGYIYTFIGFILLSFITTCIDQSCANCWLDYYHNNRKYIMINSCLEELACIILMSFIIIYHLEDKLYKLTFNLLGYYMGWFLVTSLIIKFDPNRYLNFVVTLSFLLRAFLMFYLYVYEPINQIEEHPTKYIALNNIQSFSRISQLDFQGHFKNSIILQSFSVYLQDLDNQDKDKLKQFQVKLNFLKFKQHQLYQNYMKLSEYLYQPAPMDIIEDYLIKEFNNDEILLQFDNQAEDLKQHLGEYLSNVYQIGFKNTIAFHTINNYYQTQETAIKNLETLGMKLNQYNPLKDPLKE
ncbi:unnamed protein product (macronuclear) [Paramecium tetraurelia]|uniref:Transmembrane protein n=1 Tax=Paramecium tetraurelia TaxID=5888 RepID=A0DG24_PARTE|nr:uncharacterized protein GSPATT00002119001 [Paramecium tetraurelia]CAK81991.1 unnamed protein product [Paramecium tetraurelia]|eukprot:XP_001449388.1 hypothetical protein (macronuclear) [Paramecium tetraurelia strain d4-2]